MPRKEKPRFCKACGKQLKQKYVQFCIHCRQLQRRRKPTERALQEDIKELFDGC